MTRNRGRAKKKKRKKKKGRHRNPRKTGVIGVEACINRLPISLPLDRPIL